MIGITLSSEQIRTASAEVRRWIEHEVATSLGLQVRVPNSQSRIEQLAICSLDELALYGRDGGYCFIAAQTQQNILSLWRNVIGRGELGDELMEAASADGPSLRETAFPNDRDRPAAFGAPETQPVPR